MPKKEISNRSLNNARTEKKGEFYTQLTDIEKELKFYKNYFKGKVVYCNCDDPRVSQFFNYFSSNFKHLKLKKLITTCYKNQDMDLFTRNKSQKAIFLEYDGNKNNDLVLDPKKIGIKYLNGDGDFRSEESIALLKQADIVVTNPPFYLFREYISQLFKYEKKFLIIGNINAVSNKEVAVLMKENKLWLGPSIHSGDREFQVPDDYPLEAANFRTDEKGNKYIRVKGVRWFTNLDHEERHKPLILYKKYYSNKKEYPKFDNYNAINVNFVKDIPKDYEGAMGVPLTFMDKYNPEQFEIISCNSIKTNKKINDKEHGLIKDKDSAINGKPTYVRIVIKNKILEK
jgi:hypothetical protein